MKPANVELHIEELILHGFAAGDRYLVGEALERELTRLVGSANVPSLLAQSIDVERVDGGAFRVAPGSRAETVGAQVAQAVHGGLKR